MALYVHIPFCVAKCYYCSFHSYAIGRGNCVLRGLGQRNSLMERYVRALLQEGEKYSRSDYFAGKTFDSLYIGGGTPTCLTGGQLYLLLASLRELFGIPPEAEITVEANPGTLDSGMLRKLREGGCNRLSLGVQSFDSRELKALGRIHQASDVYNTFNEARREGFANINIDLMYGLPGQDLRQWAANLKEGVELRPEHISLYQLSLEENTPFYDLLQKGLLAEFAEDTAAEMYSLAQGYLTANGYGHYEISNYAKFGRESVHNKTYWKYNEYLGLGSGATGFLGGNRYTNYGDIHAYCDAVIADKRPVEAEEIIDTRTAMAEMIFMGLRLKQGVSKKDFAERFTERIEDIFGETIQRLKAKGLLEESTSHVFLSEKAIPLANIVFIEFLP